MNKKVERMAKRLKVGVKHMGVSAIPPAAYAERFKKRVVELTFEGMNEVRGLDLKGLGE